MATAYETVEPIVREGLDQLRQLDLSGPEAIQAHFLHAEDVVRSATNTGASLSEVRDVLVITHPDEIIGDDDSVMTLLAAIKTSMAKSYAGEIVEAVQTSEGNPSLRNQLLRKLMSNAVTAGEGEELHGALPIASAELPEAVMQEIGFEFLAANLVPDRDPIM